VVILGGHETRPNQGRKYLGRDTALTWKSESGHEQYSIQTNIHQWCCIKFKRGN
jgi:hypothetical protein